MPSDISLSISIVCYETPLPELETLFQSLALSVQYLKNTYPDTECRLLLIDNSESGHIEFARCDALSLLITTQRIELQIIQGHGNIGFARGHNLAIESSMFDYHLILNTDIRLAPETLLNGVKYLQSEPEAVLVSPYVIDAYGKRQFLCKRYPSLLTLFLRGFCPEFIRRLFKQRLARYEYRDKERESEPWQAEIVSGCFMLCRASALGNVNGFDPAYFLYFEDFDLSLRMATQGRVMFLPTMRIEHYGGGAARKGRRHVLLFIRSAWTFYSTHGWRFIRQ